MVSYLAAQKQKVRITLDLEVFQDFDARQIDWDKLFNLEPGENVDAYVEEFDNDFIVGNPPYNFDDAAEVNQRFIDTCNRLTDGNFTVMEEN